MSEKEKYPSELAERFQIRLPLGLRDRIKAAAEANNRSMNSEIVARLLMTFEQRMLNLTDTGISALLMRLDATVEALDYLMFYVKNVRLDEYIADQAKLGNIMTTEEAVYNIVTEYLSEKGYASQVLPPRSAARNEAMRPDVFDASDDQEPKDE